MIFSLPMLILAMILLLFYIPIYLYACFSLHECIRILQINQEISIRGVGRLVIEDTQQTSKGRFKVKMRKFT